MKRFLILFVLIAAIRPAHADDFDRLEGPILSGLAQNPDAQAHALLTLKDLGNQSSVLKGIRSALVCVTTDTGNHSRLLVSAGLRKSANSKNESLPILVIERFDTLEGGMATSRVAR